MYLPSIYLRNWIKRLCSLGRRKSVGITAGWLEIQARVDAAVWGLKSIGKPSSLETQARFLCFPLEA